MASIFQIEKDLINLFDKIEANGGLLTEDDEKALAINKETLKDKIRAYSYVMTSINNDINAIDAETTRLKNLKDSKTKAYKKLENIVADAIEMFGDETKNGGKFVDFGTGKLSLRINPTVKVDEDFVNTTFTNFFKSMADNPNVKDSSMIDNVNRSINAANNKNIEYVEDSENAKELTIDDMNYGKIEVSFAVTLRDVINNEILYDRLADLSKLVAEDDTDVKIKASVNKTSIKNEIFSTGVVIPYAQIENVKHITIN